MKIPRTEWDKPDEQPKLLPEGLYFVEITDAKEDDRGEYLAVHYKVLACPHAPTLVGSREVERFYFGNAIGKLSILAKRLGLQERGDPTEEAAELDEQSLIGGQVIVQLEHQRRVSQKGTEYDAHQWIWGKYWPLDHKDAPQDFVRALTQRTAPSRPHAPAVTQPMASASNGARQTVAAVAPVQDDDL